MLQFATQEEFNKARYERLKSNYNIDFSELPNEILAYYKNIFDGWWESDLNTPDKYNRWINDKIQYFNNLPEKYRLNAFSKLIEYIKGKCQYHLDFDCKELKGACKTERVYAGIIDSLNEAFTKWKKAKGMIVPKKYNDYFIDSRLEIVPVDFDSISAVAVRPLLNAFDKNESLRTNENYGYWLQDLQKTLKLIPNDLRSIALQKAIEHGNGAYHLHLKECTNPESCTLNETWDARLVSANDLLQSMQQPAKAVTQPVVSQTNTEKLKWAGQKNVLYHVLRQLKDAELISNSYNSLAEFLIQNVTGFQEGAKETIEKELKKSQAPAKARRINIDLNPTD